MRVQRHRPDQVMWSSTTMRALLRRAHATFPGDVEVFANAEVTGLSGARNTGVRAARATWSPSSMTTPRQSPTGSRSWSTGISAPCGWCRRYGAGSLARECAVPAGSRRSSTGWWAAATEACRTPSRHSAISSAPPCHSAVLLFERSVTSTRPWAASARCRSDARRPNSHSAFARPFSGTELVHVPFARVHHHVGAERTKVGYFLRRCYAEGISKAAVAERAGSEQALASERTTCARRCPKESLTACEPAFVATSEASPVP